MLQTVGSNVWGFYFIKMNSVDLKNHKNVADIF